MTSVQQEFITDSKWIKTSILSQMLFFWILYSKNPEKYPSPFPQKILSSTIVFNIDNKTNASSTKSEYKNDLKDRVTLKTEVKAAENSALPS